MGGEGGDSGGRRGLVADEFAYGAVEVEEEGGGGLVGHGVGDGDAEGFDANAQADGEAREEIARVGAHIGACLVIVGQRRVELFRRSYLNSEDQMTEKIGKETRFHFELLSVVARRMGIVGQFPTRKVGSRNGHAEG